jgi:hypothetical protein
MVDDVIEIRIKASLLIYYFESFYIAFHNPSIICNVDWLIKIDFKRIAGLKDSCHMILWWKFGSVPHVFYLIIAEHLKNNGDCHQQHLLGDDQK